MTDTIELTGLDGTNPLGFLAALGTIAALERMGCDARMGWTDGLVPHPVVTGVDDGDALITALDEDRVTWAGSVALTGPKSEPLDDAKPPPGVDAAWATEVVATLTRRRADADLYAALVAEGAVDGNGNGKPTHLHFTAGQQRFLAMARELGEHVDRERFHEAVFGPWRMDGALPSLSWDIRGGRPYALQASDPSKVKRQGVPGADWLALLGLASIPVRAVSSTYDGSISLETTGCDRSWKQSEFRWPLWDAPLRTKVIRSVVADPALVGDRKERAAARGRGLSDADYLRGRGVRRVLAAPIRRTYQGGYGSFGGADTIAEAALG